MPLLPPQEALVRRVIEDYERLAQRPATAAESEVVCQVLDGRSVWATGLRAEGLVHIAMSLSNAARKKVLFVSPARDLLKSWQHRLGPRGPCLPLREAASSASPGLPLTAWATPNDLDPVLLGRVFGSEGPAVILLENLDAATPTSHCYRPSFQEISDVIGRFPKATLIGSSSSSEEALRKSVGQVLGTQVFDKSAPKPKGAAAALISENTVGDDSKLSLRIKEQGEASAGQLISPLPRPALVICGTPAQADQVFLELEAAQVPVHRFHSALSASERARQLLHFALPGRRAVMVAVSAFGPSSGFAGGDEPAVPESFGRGYYREDLRSIVHLCAPCSLAQYATELSLLAPVVTRDSDTDETPQNVALMVYSPTHAALNLALLDRKRPVAETLQAIVAHVLSQSGETWIDERDFDRAVASRRDLETCLRFLADSGTIERERDQVRTTATIQELKATAQSLSKAFKALTDGDTARLAQVEDYALSKECRAQVLAGYLGRPPVAACGNCDVCAPALDEGSNTPTIQTRPARRRTPAKRQVFAEVEAEDLEEELG